MQAIRLGVKRLHPDAILPQYQTAGAACFDLHALIEQGSDQLINGEQGIYRTGLAFDIPPGWVLKVYSRSGHGFKHSVRLSNAVGVVDSDYVGEVMVALHNDGFDNLVVNHGDRIAQAMLEPAPSIELFEVDELTETARGANGFGSTGV